MSNNNDYSSTNNFVELSLAKEMEEEQLEDVQSISSDSSANLVPAVLVQNVRKSYKRGEPVINNLSMLVKTGSIYGLLGASGCGKTTILSTIVGVKQPDAGNVLVFGQKPGSPGSGIPGRTVGYMPQDIALFPEFTISETLHYFGRLYSMKNAEVEARMQFLIEFLQLPDVDTLVKNLSGGTQRRLSLAVSMIHRPRLLVLDEPTVGLDPLLRENIWNHLKQIVEQQQTTIIITTHYIQESGMANTVGIMRNGRLLVEQAPDKLLKEYSTPFLEKVFLKLCADDDQGLIPDLRVDYDYSKSCNPRRKSVLAGLEDSNVIKGMTYKTSDADCIDNNTVWSKDVAISPKSKDLGPVETASAHANKIYALMIKTFLFLIRTPWFGMVVILLPPIQIITFLLIVGHDPKNIVLGLVNHELPNESSLDFCKTLPRNECFPTGVSCRFLNNFPSEEFQWIEYKSDEEALLGVQRGESWGFISIPKNYTMHMLDRSVEKMYMTNSTIDGSIISSRLDVSFNLKSDFIKQKAYKYFQTFLTDISSTCKTDPRTVEVPLKFNAIYGGLGSTHLDYIQPGFFALTIILLPMSCALRVIQDRKNGTLQRSVVAGLEYIHTLIELLISQGIIVAVQVLLCYGIMVIAGINIEGAVWQFLLLVFLVGMVGLSIGFLAGQAVDHEVESVFIILACYLPLMVSSGATWPFEGMPFIARVIYTSLPVALPIKSLRSIGTRGWGITHPKVYPGFIMVTCWIVGLCVLSAIVKRIRNK